jgi:hypothetical protein
MSWRTGKPPEHGYYLAAWRHTGVHDSRYHVSELWFNPSTGWFTERAYFGERHDYYDFMYTRKEVVAWMPMPRYDTRS